MSGLNILVMKFLFLLFFITVIAIPGICQHKFYTLGSGSKSLSGHPKGSKLNSHNSFGHANNTLKGSHSISGHSRNRMKNGYSSFKNTLNAKIKGKSDNKFLFARNTSNRAGRINKLKKGGSDFHNYDLSNSSKKSSYGSYAKANSYASYNLTKRSKYGSNSIGVNSYGSSVKATGITSFSSTKKTSSASFGSFSNH